MQPRKTIEGVVRNRPRLPSRVPNHAQSCTELCINIVDSSNTGVKLTGSWADTPPTIGRVRIPREPWDMRVPDVFLKSVGFVVEVTDRTASDLGADFHGAGFFIAIP